MIVHLDGEHETVDYIDDRSVLVYDNVENEEYPLHWHDALEIIMPLANSFTAVCEGKFCLSRQERCTRFRRSRANGSSCCLTTG